MWRCIIDGGQSLSEVQTWDLEDVDKFLALLDMRECYQTAYAEYKRQELPE